MINADVTLRRLIWEIAAWANAHEMIQKFGYGEFLQLIKEQEKKYPYFMCNISNAGEDQWFFKYSIDVCVWEWVWDDRENQARSESDTHELIRDFTNTIRISNRWQSFSKISGDITHRKFIEKGEDKVTGWCGTINLWVKKRSGICQLESLMPEYDFETPGTSGCAPVETILGGVSFGETAAGGTKSIAVVDPDGNPVVVTKIDDETAEVPGGSGSFTYDLYFDSEDTGEEVVVDGTDITINLD